MGSTTLIFWISVGLAGAGILAMLLGAVLVVPPGLAARRRIQMVSDSAKPLTGASKQLQKHLESFQVSAEQLNALSARATMALNRVRENLEHLRHIANMFMRAG